MSPLAHPERATWAVLQVSQAEVLIEERDEEICKVVETIAELAQIMRDLSTLVVEQGTMLDRIDTNITQAAVKVRADGMAAGVLSAAVRLPGCSGSCRLCEVSDLGCVCWREDGMWGSCHCFN